MASVKETKLDQSGNAEDVGQKQRHPYTFHIGASWAAKSDSCALLPHPSDTVGSWRDHMLTRPGSSSRKGIPGDDFFFIQQMRNQSGVSFGVADGVGGCARIGVESSLFAQALMYYAHQSSRNVLAGESEIDPTMDYEEREQINGQELTPYECLDLAYSSVLEDKHVEAGSSTACIVSLDASSGVLRSANLGDSGYSIIRSNSIFYTSPLQTHFFNCPKQLSKPPGVYFDDKPSMADTHEVELRDGDIVIVYTDGLSDNVFPSEIVSTICSHVAEADATEDEQVQNMADNLVDYAQRCMRSLTKVSPFGIAMQDRWLRSGGGKPDDITVIVGLVRETS